MGSLSMSADVYSFAMIMLELWTGEAIYKDIPAHQACCRSCLLCRAACAPQSLDGHPSSTAGSSCSCGLLRP